MNQTNEPKEVVVKSTLLQAYRYDPHNYTLSVTFRDGTEAEYYGVMPPAMSGVFDSGGSVGSRFARQIMKGKYKFKITS